MCGLAGFILGKQFQITGKQMAQMAKIMRHRGPDDEGYAVFSEHTHQVFVGDDTPVEIHSQHNPIEAMKLGGKVQFIFRRLSIIDLSPLGHQPLCYMNRYWLIFNGEIYNYRELRNEMEGLGYLFASQTDSEVILACYAHYGIQALEKFNGMFAFALYDMVEKKILIARDRFGVKPLYLWRLPDGGLGFASEIKIFTAIDEFRARCHHQMAYDFLTSSLQDHTNQTMFDGVVSLPAGHYIYGQTDEIIERQKLPIKPYYQLPYREFKGGYDDAVHEFYNILESSVAYRMRSDVPVGASLSGGMDSSSILAVASKILHQNEKKFDMESFSACFDDKKYDEREYIYKVIDKIKPKPNYIFPSLNNLFAELPQIIWHQDEPFSSTSIYAEWCVYKAAAQKNIKVMLGGQGADEQLAGYHMYLGVVMAGLLKHGKLFHLSREWQAIHKIHGYSHIALLMRLFGNVTPWLNKPVARLLNRTEGQLNWLNFEKFPIKPYDSLLLAGSRTDNLRHLSSVQLKSTYLPVQLHWEDRDSMAHSIETRHPFLDYRLVEFIHSLPNEFKYNMGISKRVLKSAMKDLVPSEIINRTDKMGFVTPESNWVKSEGTVEFRAHIVAAIDASAGLLTSEVLTIFDDMVANRRPFDYFIWRVLSFGAWVRRFNVAL